MKINSKIENVIKENHNFITTYQFVSLGYSKTLLQDYVKEGLLERCMQGIYTLPDSDYDEMYLLMISSKKIVFSHETALFLNGLSNRTPFSYSVTIPSNSSLPKSVKDDCDCFYIKPELYSLGIVSMKTSFGNEVRCYNAERTICDMLRSRNSLDEETVISAIKNYALWKDKDLNRLGQYAKKFKVDKILKMYMEVLL